MANALANALLIPAYSRGVTPSTLAAALSGPQPATAQPQAFVQPEQQAPRPLVAIGNMLRGDDRSDALAQALMQSANSGSPRTPFEAIGKLAQLWAGQRAEDRYLKKQDEKARAPIDALRTALANGTDPTAALLASENPELFLEGLKRKTAPPPAPIKLGANDTLVDPNTLQPIYTAPGGSPKGEVRELNGRLVMVNPNGTVNDITPQGTPSGYRPATPEERAAYGLDAKTPLMIGPDGKPATLGGSNVTVNVGPDGIDYGEPPKDMAWARNPDGSVALEADSTTGYKRPRAVPIAGGPVETAAAEAAKKAEVGAAEKKKYADIVTQDIDRAIAGIDNAPYPITGWGSITSRIPGTPGYDVARLLDTVKANTSFDKLQAMREASPTGGALGQVSDFENKLLQAVIGNLELSQSKEQLLQNLGRVKSIYGRIVNEGIKPGDPVVGEIMGGSSSRAYPEIPNIGEALDGWIEVAPGVRLREVK